MHSSNLLPLSCRCFSSTENSRCLPDFGKQHSRGLAEDFVLSAALNADMTEASWLSCEPFVSVALENLFKLLLFIKTLFRGNASSLD